MHWCGQKSTWTIHRKLLTPHAILTGQGNHHHLKWGSHKVFLPLISNRRGRFLSPRNERVPRLFSMKNRLRILLAEKGTREDRNISMRKAAEELGFDVNTLTRLANNKLKQLPIDVLDVLCNYLECEIGDLLQHDHTAGKQRDLQLE